jgi:murein DD-endopeptidase MepM/ murein hydrolase activator NlpD
VAYLFLRPEKVLPLIVLFWLLSIILPQAEARFLEMFQKILGKTDIISSEANSQVLPLLQAPINLDPAAGTGGGEISIVQDSALLPVVGPLGSIADIGQARAESISLYVVRKGDNISTIAKLFNVSENTVRWANNLERSTLIIPGQVLVILPVSGVQYTVKKGDTIESISKKFKGDEEEILNFNGLASNISLEEGMNIIIPNGEGEPIPTYYSRNLIGGTGPDYRGYYLRPVEGGRRSQGLHGYNAVDFAAPCGTPLLASASGDVIISRSLGWNGGYGQYVVIDHPNGTQTLYAHMNGIIVSSGWHVVQGQVLGYIGRTGASTGCHVHFEVRGARNPF